MERRGTRRQTIVIQGWQSLVIVMQSPWQHSQSITATVANLGFAIEPLKNCQAFQLKLKSEGSDSGKSDPFRWKEGRT